MSFFDAIAGGIPALLGGGGGSTEVSTSNSQSFSGSLSPVFNISLGGGIESNPINSQEAVAPSTAFSAPKPPDQDPFGLFDVPVFAQPSLPSQIPFNQSQNFDMIFIMVIGAGAFFFLKDSF